MLAAGALAAPLILGGPKTLWFTPIVYDRFYQAFNWHAGLGLRHHPAARPASPSCWRCMRLFKVSLVGDRAMTSSRPSGALMIGFYIALFFVFLFGPLVVMGVTAFNTPTYPQAYPFEGFTLQLVRRAVRRPRADGRAVEQPR